MSEAAFAPNWASPPGESISRQMLRTNVDTHDLAHELMLSLNEVRGLLAGLLPITEDISRGLSRLLGGSSQYWLERGAMFRACVNELPIECRFDPLWLEAMPYREIARLGWVPNVGDQSARAEALLAFFGMQHSAQWSFRYPDTTFASAFRTSAAFETKHEAVASWLRRGEQIAAKIDCARWDRLQFGRRLGEIRRLTKNKRPSLFFPELRRICAECGVAVVAAPTPNGCRASGATQFLSKDKALLMLSFRFKSDDHFWFSFFHEAGHLMLHDIDAIFVDEAFSMNDTEEERQANQFAQDHLIPPEYRGEMLRLGRRTEAVQRFAIRIGTSSGIVVGQMQKHQALDPAYLNRLKRRYSDEEIEAAFNH